jgi:hypothetical protein
MVEKFQKLSKIMTQMGMGQMRVMTDFSAERFWTVIAETEVPDLAEYTKRSREASEAKETREIMQGYHEIVESGRREIYVIEK